MNSKIIADAVLGFVITFGTAAVALLAQEGVAGVHDVSQAAWLSAFIGALVGAAKTVQSGLAMPQGFVDAMKRNQSGFASPRLLVMLAVASLLAITLGGCSLQPQTAREALALGYTAHTATTRTVTAATTSESITVDQAQQARASLVLARQQLEIAQSLVTADKPAADPLWRANSALQIVEQILTEAERHADQ